MSGSELSIEYEERRWHLSRHFQNSSPWISYTTPQETHWTWNLVVSFFLEVSLSSAAPSHFRVFL